MMINITDSYQILSKLCDQSISYLISTYVLTQDSLIREEINHRTTENGKCFSLENKIDATF